MDQTIKVAFDIRSDLYNIYIIDNSCWGIAQNLPSVIEITIPGIKEPYKDYFGKKDTSYDSLSLGLSCGDSCDNVELPDGIYHILLKASPSTFNEEHFYIKTDKLTKLLDEAYLKMKDFDYDSQCKKDLFQAVFLRDSAESAIRKSDIKLASEYYSDSHKIVSRLNNCKTCS